MAEILKIQLHEIEQGLFSTICWDMDELVDRTDPEVARTHLEAMGVLANSLLQRKAIPQVRLSYFTEPEMYVGGHGKSRKQQFEKNGSKGTNYLCHPHFMTILWYFISGPDLPKSTIDEFCKIIDEDMGTSGMVLTQIMAFVRREVREKQLKSNAAEEFFKLAHEICKPDLAVHVRSAAVSARR